MDEKRIALLMKQLDIPRDEAIEVLKEDSEIDKGAELFELTPEQKQVEKKMRQADRKVTAYSWKPRERKPNETKRELINHLNDFLIDFVHEHDENCIDGNVFIINPERQIDFTYKNVRYRIVLSAPRK